MRRILIANRGDAALRIARAAADAGLDFRLVHAEDDRGRWTRAGAAASEPLAGRGPAAYLDGAALIAIARRTGCDALHPGWGFLSERADFAQDCAAAGLTFIGPSPETLALFGDKTRARAFAKARGVPVAEGIDGPASLDEAKAFFASLGGAPVMVKAIGGGGGRGLRAAHSVAELEAAYVRAQSEAQRGFGGGGVFVERLVAPARHIEAQLAGDGEAVVALGQRDCSLQYRRQKWVEFAPPNLPEALAKALDAAALTLAQGLLTLATFEFLVDEAGAFFFIEANPRLQVEHGVTEETTGLDLARAQIALSAGARLADLGMAAPPPERGAAIEWRIVAEGGGRLSRLRPCSGPGLRVDVAAQEGDEIALAFDPLIAKLIVRGGDLADAARRSRRALAEWELEGAPSNLAKLRALAEQDFGAAFSVDALDRRFGASAEPVGGGDIAAPLSGRLVEIAPDGEIAAGAAVAVIEAMKMEHVVAAPCAGRLSALARAGDFVAAGTALARLEQRAAAPAAPPSPTGLGETRADLARVEARWAATADAARPEAIAKRHALGLRSARENIADLVDPGTFQEYGAFAVAAQTQRRSMQDLVANTPADGIVVGTGLVNGALFAPERAKAAVLAYDATVLAGTQGLRGHEKTDRLIDIADRRKLPVVLFAEGGGGRPGDTDAAIVAGLHLTTFARFAGLSGRAPLIGVVAGRCFAGNAALLGCCDVIVATRDANIGMGGPAMIEGGGLGRHRPEEIGPAALQAGNGVVDALVADEAAAVAFAKAALGFFQGDVGEWTAADPNALRVAIPENRVRAYDMRALMRGVLDQGAMLELRAGYGPGLVTALGRIEGRALGLLANDPGHLGGAIDAEGAEKAARFLQLCAARGLPVLSLIDTPGFMVGPEVETRGHVRACADFFIAAARLTTPHVAIVVRRGYGLGAMAMAGGGFHAPDLIAAWPSGEFGPMGLEGAVRLGYRRELEAAPDPAAREVLFKTLLAAQYERGGAISMASALEIDAVIDPAETRGWIMRALSGAGRKR